jgi:hypothetical protein
VPRRRGRARVARALGLLAALGALAVALPAIFIGVRCVRPGVTAPARSADVERVAASVRDYVRPGAATYLTVPEWYIVYSTEEYAAFLRGHPPSEFPYLGASRQYWEYYGAMCDATRGVYPVDAGNHLMLGVIGVSFAAENLVKAGWENTLGRLAEWLGGHATDEDAFAQRTAAEYARFMHTVPWYQFPFGARLAALWRETGLWGRAPVRKWERKLALSAEYVIKAAYAWVIRRATGAVYEPEAERIHVWILPAPPAALADPRVRRVRDFGPAGMVVTLPRYEPFTDLVRALARQGVRFRDVAGNDAIVISAIARGGARPGPDAGTILFSAPILTDPVAARLVLRTPVPSLHAALPALEYVGVRMEHVYDY